MDKAPSEITIGLLARLRNPVLASFGISWCIVNWKLWIYIFAGDLSSAEKVQKVTAAVTETNSYLYPLVFAVVYSLFAQWLWLAVGAYADLATNIRARSDHRIRASRLPAETALATQELELIRSRRTAKEIKDEERRIKESTATTFSLLRDQLHSKLAEAEVSLRERLADTMSSVGVEATALSKKVGEDLRTLAREEERAKDRLIEVIARFSADTESRLSSEREVVLSSIENAMQKLRIDTQTAINQLEQFTRQLADQRAMFANDLAASERWLTATEHQRKELATSIAAPLKAELASFNKMLMESARVTLDEFNDGLDQRLGVLPAPDAVQSLEAATQIPKT